MGGRRKILQPPHWRWGKKKESAGSQRDGIDHGNATTLGIGSEEPAYVVCLVRDARPLPFCFLPVFLTLDNKSDELFSIHKKRKKKKKKKKRSRRRKKMFG